MQNSEQKQKSMVQRHVENAPQFIIFLTYGNFILTAFIWYFFYHDVVFANLTGEYRVIASAALATLLTGLRLGSMLISIKDLKNGDGFSWLGVLGVACSIFLSYMCYKEVPQMSEIWGNGHVHMALGLLIWSGCGLEVRLLFSELSEIGETSTIATLTETELQENEFFLGLQNNIVTLQTDIEGLIEEKKDLSEAVKTLSIENNDMKENIQKIEKKVTKMKEELEELEEERDKLQSKLSKATTHHNGYYSTNGNGKIHHPTETNEYENPISMAHENSTMRLGVNTTPPNVNTHTHTHELVGLSEKLDKIVQKVVKETYNRRKGHGYEDSINSRFAVAVNDYYELLDQHGKSLSEEDMQKFRTAYRNYKNTIYGMEKR